jgi:RNA polymerase sigma-70 factor (ECF subfamily)
LPALQAHLILRRGLQAQDAADLVQDFVTNKILERDLVSRADRSRGRFRAFLLTALDRYFVDRHRYSTAQKRAAGETFSIDSGQVDPPDKPAVDAFDVAWARAVLREALQLMKQQCDAERASRIWETFRLRILEPLITGEAPLDYASLVKRCGFESPRQASNALITARRRFHRCLQDVVGEYTSSPEELEEEIEELRATLATTGALNEDVLRIEADSSDDASLGVSLRDGTLGLADLFNLEKATAHHWQAAELDQLARHLMETPLSQLISWPQAAQIASGWLHRRTSDLLTAADPPLPLLEETKQLGRSWARQEAGSMPAELGATLYFASIAAALVRHGQRISSSPDSVLHEGFCRLLDRPWMDPRIREVLRAGVAQLRQ